MPNENEITGPLELRDEVVGPYDTKEEALAREHTLERAFKAGLYAKHLAARTLYEIDLNRSWAALGYKSMWDYLRERKLRKPFGHSAQYCHSLIAQGKALAQGAPQDSAAGALMEMAKLNGDPAAQEKAIDEAVRNSPGRKMSRKTAALAVKKHRSVATERSVPDEHITLPGDPFGAAKALIVLACQRSEDFSFHATAVTLKNQMFEEEARREGVRPTQEGSLYA